MKNQDSLDSLLKRADKAQLSGQKQGGNMVIVAGTHQLCFDCKKNPCCSGICYTWLRSLSSMGWGLR